MQAFSSARVSCPHGGGICCCVNAQVTPSSPGSKPLASSGASSTPLSASMRECGGIPPLPGLFLARHPAEPLRLVLKPLGPFCFSLKSLS